MRKRTYRRKRRMNKKRTTRKSVVPRQRFSSDIHYFKRIASDVTISGNVAYAPYLNVFRYSLNQLPNVSEYTNLFDRYMITKVVTKLYLKIDPSAQAAATASFPRLFYARDVDDSGVPASLDELRQHSTCKIKVMNPNYPVTLVSRPNLLQLAYTSGVASNYIPKWKQWIDLGDTGTPHYAWKFAIDDLTNTNYRVQIDHIFYFRCKDSR